MKKKVNGFVNFARFLANGDDQREAIWLLAIIATSMAMLFSSILFA